MAIFKKCKIGYIEYDVEGVSKDIAEQLEIHGQIDYSKEKIIYNKELKKRELFNTLLHECLHGIFHFHNTQFKNKNEEELIVHTIANGLTALLLDNPEFIDFLNDSFSKK